MSHLAQWTPERIDKELTQPLMLRRDTCDETILHLVNHHRSALLALQEAREEIARLSGASCPRCDGTGVIGKHYDSSDVVCSVCRGRPDWLAARDARMKKIGAAEVRDELARVEALGVPQVPEDHPLAAFAARSKALVRFADEKAAQLRREAGE